VNSTLCPANQINRLEHAAEEAENPTINQIVWTAADTYICPHTHRENHPLSIHSTGRPADGLIPNQKDVVAATVERDPDVGSHAARMSG